MSPVDESMEIEEKDDVVASKLPDSTYDDDDDLVRIRISKSVSIGVWASLKSLILKTETNIMLVLSEYCCTSSSMIGRDKAIQVYDYSHVELCSSWFTPPPCVCCVLSVVLLCVQDSVLSFQRHAIKYVGFDGVRTNPSSSYALPVIQVRVGHLGQL